MSERLLKNIDRTLESIDLSRRAEPAKHLFRFAKDATGATVSAVENTLGGAIHFEVAPSETEFYVVNRLVVHIHDGGSVVPENYGGIGGGVTNGVIVRVTQDSNPILTLTPEPIKNNADWGRYCYDVAYNTGLGQEIVSARWTFAKGGKGIALDGALNQRLEVVFNDNFSGLIDHTFLAHGWIA